MPITPNEIPDDGPLKDTTITAWHASPRSDLDGFHALTHFGTRQAAVDRTYSRGFKWEGEEASLYEVQLQVSKPLWVQDFGKAHDMKAMLAAIQVDHPRLLRTNQTDIILGRWENGDIQGAADGLAYCLKAAGYDALVYTNWVEDPFSTSCIILEPGQVQIMEVHPFAKPDDLEEMRLDSEEAPDEPTAPGLRF